jgi:hypothetical protein
MENNKYFYCYSKMLKGFIDTRNIRYIRKDIHNKSKRPFYLYLVNSELDDVLKQWDNFKKNKLE